MTYTELIQLIADYLQREDMMDVEIPSFIKSVEAKMNRGFRFGQMSKRSQVTADGTTDWFAFPDEYLACRSIKVGDTPLEYLVPEQMDRRIGTELTQSYYYTIQAQQFRILPTPGDGAVLEITFYEKIPALSESNPTNWVLDDFFDFYYYGALAEAMLYIKNDERYTLWNTKFQEAASAMDDADLMDRWSGSPTAVRSI